MSPLSIDVANVTVAYPNGHTALRDASFHLHQGTIAALVGVNGSGKSTLFKALMGFVRPVSGSILIAGSTVEQARKLKLVAYVPQSEEVDWSFPVSVWDVVMMGRYGHMNFLRIASAEDKRIVTESLARVGMTEFKDRQIGELSGGQKKRVFLARGDGYFFDGRAMRQHISQHGTPGLMHGNGRFLLSLKLAGFC